VVKNYLQNSAKKSNGNYSNQFKIFRKLKKLRKFDVDGISVLEQLLEKLEDNTDLTNGEVFTKNQAFDSILTECEKLRALAFLFSSSKLDEENSYDLEIKSGSAALLKSIAENIEKFLIIFANNDNIVEVKI